LQSQEDLSPPQIFTKFIEDILLREISDPIVIFMDDFDCLLSLESDLREDFFSLLKVLYERRNFENKYNRLNFVLSFIYLDSELIQNKLYVSPPSMNAIINLDNFSYEEALPLAQGLRGKTSNPEKLLREVLWWTGGQPFLTQKICHLIQKSQDYVPEGNEKIWLEELVRNQVIDNWKIQDQYVHFDTIESFILNNKRKANELLRAYRTILLQEEHSDKNNEIIDILTNTAGIVVRKNGKLQVANRIYAEIFNLEWIETTLAKLRSYSTYYIERPPLEKRCYEEISKEGCLLRIKAPHQMGKTALLHKILDYAKKQNYMTVLIDFQLPSRSVFDNLETFLKWFTLSITNSLDLPNKMDEYWDNKFMPITMRCFDYLEEYILNEIQTPLILCLDEFSRIFDYPAIAQDFLSLLRSWHGNSHYDSLNSNQWKKLRLVLSLSTEMYSIQPIQASPFNVGIEIKLPEFNHEQVESLVRAYGINLETSQVNELTNIIGGHPYLIQSALKAIWDYNLSLEQLLEKAPTEEGIYSDHLREKLLTLEQYPELKDALKQVISQENPIRLESVLAYKLEALGLVVFTGNKVTIRNNLYRLYFQDILFTS